MLPETGTAQKILIVDDNPRNLLVLEQALEDTGATVIQAADGQEALRLSLGHDFALAILDVQMPGMTGFELAEFLRSDAKTRHLPVIFLSAAATELDDFYQGYKTGAVDYIVKPFKQAILLAKVTVFLELDAQRRKLDAQRQILEDTNRELEAFSYSVSHDLRAPLRRIIGFSQVLVDDYADQLPDDARDYLQRVARSALKMDMLIQDLLQLSRTTRKELGIQRISLSELAQSVETELRQREPDRTVEVQIQPELFVDADPVLMKVVLDNLLGNAWKYSSRSEGARIEVGLGEHAGGPAYFVRDNGAGFDMDQVSRIFDPFVRLHTGDQFEGSGIGLATVQRIIHRHGGRIWATGEVDAGATFYFKLHR